MRDLLDMDWQAAVFLGIHGTCPLNMHWPATHSVPPYMDWPVVCRSCTGTFLMVSVVLCHSLQWVFPRGQDSTHLLF